MNKKIKIQINKIRKLLNQNYKDMPFIDDEVIILVSLSNEIERLKALKKISV